MKEAFDKNGNKIECGMEVEMPVPNNSDIWNFDFVGTVEDILDDGTIIVIDQEFDCFQIEASRVEIF